MKNLIIVLLVMIFSLASTTSQAQTKRLDVADNIPENIILKNQLGEGADLNSLYGDKGMVMVFYRSAAWCPYCQAQLINLKAYQDDIEAKGYNIVAISYDAVEELKKFSDKRKISFPLLSDANSETIKAFGILNEEHEVGSFAYGVPHPAVYVVNKDGSIKGVLHEDGYKKRPEVSAILEVIEK